MQQFNSLKNIKNDSNFDLIWHYNFERGCSAKKYSTWDRGRAITIVRNKTNNVYLWLISENDIIFKEYQIDKSQVDFIEWAKNIGDSDEDDGDIETVREYPRILLDNSGSMYSIFDSMYNLIHWLQKNIKNAEFALYGNGFACNWQKASKKINFDANEPNTNLYKTLHQYDNDKKRKINKNDKIIVITDGEDFTLDTIIKEYPNIQIFLLQDNQIKQFGKTV